ncbi:PP2C family protein-serine/threonine phosphatase [Terrabacter sp. NPDC080008]|uniref:PP2C family protein-serine/threonine phosphatase n=1 Tax=Terrabacter sp. NPDC080008 TaxID=3155176 RepID=UPI00344C4895
MGRAQVFDDLLLGVLDAVEDASPLQAVEAVTETLADRLGASAAFFLAADLAGGALVRMSYGSTDAALARQGLGGSEGVARVDEGGEQSVAVPVVRGGPVEAALRTQTLQVLPAAPADSHADTQGASTGAVVLAPVTERGEVLGLLQLSVPESPDAEALAEIARIAHLLAFVIIANRRHTDLFERAERSTLFSLPAEIQRRLLPSAFTCEGGPFTLAAWLEPAASVGGDTFDYSLARDALHLSLTDAMGHGVASALTATLCVNSLRNTRRMGGSLLQQADAANTTLYEHATKGRTDHFATGLVARLDLQTGALTVVNAGHVPPYLCRGADTAVVALAPDLPLGLFADSEYQPSELVLEPGDRLVLVTDGMMERNAAALDLRDAITHTRDLHPREATRRLTALVLESCGQNLADDATVLVLDWYGDHGRARRTSSGAEQWRASARRSSVDTRVRPRFTTDPTSADGSSDGGTSN